MIELTMRAARAAIMEQMIRAACDCIMGSGWTGDELIKRGELMQWTDGAEAFLLDGRRVCSLGELMIPVDE